MTYSTQTPRIVVTNPCKTKYACSALTKRFCFGVQSKRIVDKSASIRWNKLHVITIQNRRHVIRFRLQSISHH